MTAEEKLAKQLEKYDVCPKDKDPRQCPEEYEEQECIACWVEWANK